jgi:hypothetical protein
MNLTTAFDTRRRNQCVRIAEDLGAAPAELSRLPFPRCHRLTDCTGPIIPNTPSTIKASMGAQCLATGFNAAQAASFNLENEIARFRALKPENLAISNAPVRRKTNLDQWPSHCSRTTTYELFTADKTDLVTINALSSACGRRFIV